MTLSPTIPQSQFPVLTHAGEDLPCVAAAALFQHPLLEDPPTRRTSHSAWRRYQSLRTRARELCRQCPAQRACLDRAVSGCDVSGFVAGTTEHERLAIRQQLDVDKPRLAGTLDSYLPRT